MSQQNNDSSDSSDSYNEDRIGGEKVKYKTKKKVFSATWLEDDKFKHWVVPVSGNKNLCKCTACKKTIVCGKSELLKHSKSLTHQKNIKLIKSTSKIDTLFHNATSQKLKQINFEQSVKKAEILISSYIAEHNTAFANVEHLVDMLKHAVPDSRILQEVRLKRRKCTSIIKNVIAKVEVDSLIGILQTVSI